MSGTSSRTVRIAICGIRGIPANYGGFETFTEQLAPRLVAKGFEVTVYGRTHVIPFDQPFYRGVRIRLLPAPRHKYFETPVHTLRCIFDLLRNRVDAVLICNAANSPFIWILRLVGIPVAVNVDGIERLRSKWNWVGRMWYRLGEWCSALFASRIIADAKVIERYYRDTYRKSSTVIAYGVHPEAPARARAKVESKEFDWGRDETVLFQELGVQPGRYLLYVSRLEPENNAHVVIRAHGALPAALRGEFPLLIVGDAPYSHDYIRSLRDLAGPEVRFCGYRFGSSYVTLQSGAYVYIQATEVGGTHPALVEAMGFGNCVIANGTPENEEVLSSAGLFYRKNDGADLARLLQLLLENSDLVRYLRREAFIRANACYSWETIAERYAVVLNSLAS